MLGTMKRVALFVLTNILVMVAISALVQILGLKPYLTASGIDYTSLLVFCGLFGFAGSFISLQMSRWSAKMAMGVRLIDPDNPRGREEAAVIELVRSLCTRSGLRSLPEIGIYESPELNAFATGPSQDRALLAISTGLLSRMDRSALEGVLGHEVSHIANGDMVTMTLLQGVVNTFVMFFSRIIGHTVDRVVFKTEQGHGPAFYITTIIADIVLGILASMIVMAFSRYREFRADAAGARFASSGAMIRALERLKAEHEAGAEVHMPDSMRAFGIAGGIGKLFASHPPLDKRIDALRSAM